MSDDAAVPPPAAAPSRPPRRHVVRWVLVALLILATPAAIFTGVLTLYRHLMSTAEDTPGTRRLHQIGVAIQAYAQDHGGAYPDSLADLATAQGLPADLPICPTSAPGGPYEYLYKGRGLGERSAANGTVLVYEPPAVNGGTGSHLLYADGSQVWVAKVNLDDELYRGRGPDKPRE